jgi:hypothetical protein
MVKGNSRQVIVVHNPDQKLFDQAIFILRDDAVGSGITEDMLLKSADKILHSGSKKHRAFPGFVWAFAGGIGVGLVWLLTVLI